MIFQETVLREIFASVPSFGVTTIDYTKEPLSIKRTNLEKKTFDKKISFFFIKIGNHGCHYSPLWIRIIRLLGSRNIANN